MRSMFLAIALCFATVAHAAYEIPLPSNEKLVSIQRSTGGPATYTLTTFHFESKDCRVRIYAPQRIPGQLKEAALVTEGIAVRIPNCRIEK